MGCMDNALSNLFPVDWLDPYGRMPLNDDLAVQIDITQVTTDDGIKVTAVKTPPRAGTTSIKDAISMALGMGCCEIGPQNAIQQADDLGKRETKNNDDIKDEDESSDKKDTGPSWKPGDKKKDDDKEKLDNKSKPDYTS